MNGFIKQLLTKASGNRTAQRLLERNIALAHSLMGIGAGADTRSSGESAIFRELRRLAKPPYCIFDVGANRGEFVAMTLEQLQGAECQIHAFEPSRPTYAMLSERFGNRPSIQLNLYGLGQQVEERSLYYDAEGSGLASLTKRRLDHFDIQFTKSEQVSIDTLDRYCSMHGIGHIHLLKLDVEGHELDVLHGGAVLLRDKSVDLVSFEFGGCNIDTRTYFQEFFYFFAEQGMRLHRITPSGYLVPVLRYSEVHEQFVTTNFLAVKDSQKIEQGL